MTRRLWPLLCLPLLGGCTISAVSEGDKAELANSCSSDADCVSGTQKCRDDLCQALNGTFETLLLAVTPPSDSEAPHLTFLARLEDVPTAGGNISLPMLRTANVTGSLKLALSGDCYPSLPKDGPIKYPPTTADGSLPVSVVLYPREILLGLPQQLYVATAHLQEDGTYRYSLQVPPGNYDAYFTLPQGQEGCVVPPQLFRGQQITTDTTLNYRAAVRSQLHLHVSWPKGNPPLTGWTVDIVEPLDGRVISSEIVLGEPSDPDPQNPAIPFDYDLLIDYSTVNVLDASLETPEAAHDLVRLRPPAVLAAPTLFLDRTGFGLLGSPEPVLSAFTGYPEPVRLEAWVQRADDGSPVASQVTIVSTRIDGMGDGILSSFERTVEVDETGRLELSVPPGTYRVQVVPPETEAAPALASLEEVWTLSPDVPVQAGKVLELRSDVGFRGRSRFVGASIQARPSPTALLPFEEALQGSALVPRAQSALVEGPEFVVETDPGRFDISLRASESLGYGWWVRPGVDVDTDKGIQDLGGISLPVPTVLTATATAAGSNSAVLVAFASVSAYVYLDENSAYTREPAKAVSVVQVAETRADQQGTFRLLVPAQLAGAK